MGRGEEKDEEEEEILNLLSLQLSTNTSVPIMSKH